jgi:hypothetical protein
LVSDFFKAWIFLDVGVDFFGDLADRLINTSQDLSYFAGAPMRVSPKR